MVKDALAGLRRPPRPDHRFDIDELLARRAFAGGLFLGFLDLLPVAEGDHVEPARHRERVEAAAALADGGAERAAVDVLADLADHAEPVGLVGADRARGAAAGPAYRVKPRQDAPFVVGEAPLALVERHIGNRVGAIADAADHQARRDTVALAGATGAAGDHFGALDLDRLDFAVSAQRDRLGEEVELDRDALLGAN